MTSWIKTSEREPTEKGLYLVVSDILGCYVYKTCRWTPNLYKIDEYDFPEDICNHSGFYACDSEWGYYEIKPLAWQPIEDYIEE